MRENLSQPCSERHEWRPQTAEPSHPPRHPQFVDTKMESYPTDYAPSYDINRSQPGPYHQSYTDSRSYPTAPRWEPPRHPHSQGQYVDTEGHNYSNEYGSSRYGDIGPQPGPTHQSYPDSRSYPPAPRWEAPRHPRSQGQYVDTEGHNYSNEYGSSRYGDIGPQPRPIHQSYPDSRSYPPAPRWEEAPRHPRSHGHHNYLESHPNYPEFMQTQGYRERYPEYSSHSYPAPREEASYSCRQFK